MSKLVRFDKDCGIRTDYVESKDPVGDQMNASQAAQKTASQIGSWTAYVMRPLRWRRLSGSLFRKYVALFLAVVSVALPVVIRAPEGQERGEQDGINDLKGSTFHWVLLLNTVIHYILAQNRGIRYK